MAAHYRVLAAPATFTIRSWSSALAVTLNPAYAGMARDRITDDAPLFANVALAEAAD